MKLLIADDSLLLRKSLIKLLKPLFHSDEILEAADIPATIDAIALDYPDILILDLHFQDGYGYEVMDYINFHEMQVVVIILTNLPSSKNKAKCYAKGARYFLDKSNEYGKLVQVIKQYA